MKIRLAIAIALAVPELAAAAPVALGEQTIGADVSITWEIK